MIRHSSRSSPESLATVALAALGVVFGDIGTSPLYTLRECLLAVGGHKASLADLFGILSLALWSLLLIVSVKYLTFIMQADHHGEGGIFALLALTPGRFHTGRLTRGRVTAVALLGVIGAALLYGDGVITPAISVLSAVEGLSYASHLFTPWVVPLTCLILAGLFTIQHHGTGRVGRLFGPVMLVWFLAIAALGAFHIARRPEILAALSPHHGLNFFWRHGFRGALILGGVVLAVTGAEALYADMGHFGRRPIRLAWSCLVFPSLALSYLGQGAHILEDPSAAENPFFSQLPPGPWVLPLVLLSSAATIIASQALISGAFSLTRQAMLLGYFPRVTIRHTSSLHPGQIYIPEVNWLLAAGCLGLVIAFRQSVKLAAAYGIAVTGTMAITSVLYFVVVRWRWRWPLWRAGLVFAFMLSLDLPFLAANLFKFLDGGYIPMLIAAILIAAMLIWFRGRTLLLQDYELRYPDTPKTRALLLSYLHARVPGAAIFLAPSPQHIPPILLHLAQRCRALPETVLLLTVLTDQLPTVPEQQRYQLHDDGDGFWRLVVRFGYMEQPHVIPVLQRVIQQQHLPIDLAEATFYIGHETLIESDAGKMSALVERLYSYLERNSAHPEHAYGLPPRQVIEVGAQVDL